MNPRIGVRIPAPEPVMKKNPSKKQRNAFAVQANTRGSSGPMRNKKDKRKNGKNKQQEYLSETY